MSRAHSSFIPNEEVGAVSGWNFSAVDQSSSKFAAKLRAQALAEEHTREDMLRQSGYSAGHAAGFEEGFAQGSAKATLEGQKLIHDYIEHEGATAAQNFGNLFVDAERQLKESEQAMAQGVLELACELARQVLRHELATNPNALQPVVREALSVLAVDSKAALVRLHPLDMDVLAEVLRQEFSNLSLTLLPDPTITRGGCLVESAGTVVDGTVEKRWSRVVASLGLESAWEVEE